MFRSLRFLTAVVLMMITLLWLSIPSTLAAEPLVSTLLPSITNAQGSLPELNSEEALSGVDCEKEATEKQIQIIAHMILLVQMTKEAILCFESFSLENKAHVFEAMVIEQGLPLSEIEEEAREITQFAKSSNADGRNNNYPWDQLIIVNRPWTQPLISSHGFFSSTTCDPDPNDTDYKFLFTLSSPPSPDELRADAGGSPSLGALLAYYQWRFGGLKAFGDTTQTWLHVCLGDGGVDSIGGPDFVRRHIKVFYQ